MLTELPELQESDERIWGASSVSFTIETRTEEDDELIQRTYTFGHAVEWDKWMFQEFEEKRTSADVRVTDRAWRRTRHVLWHEDEAPSVDVPPEVTEELKELLDVDKLVLQK